MDCEKIKNLVSEGIQAESVEVSGGDGKYQIAIVSTAFDGLNAVKRQQSVYRIINPYITTGEIHAVSMYLKTPSEA